MSESGSLLGTLLSFAGSGQGIEQNNAYIDAALRAQEIENQRTREHNLRLAEKQNQWNLDMWNRQNAYNSPEQQVARLRAAGLNPDMMMGGGISNTSTSSPQMTSGAAATPMDWSALANKRTIGDTIQQSLQNQLTQAQIDNINADTNKKGAEASILTDQAAFTKAIQQGQLNLQNAQISLIGKQGDLTEQQIIESQQRCLSIEASTKQIYANIEKINTDIDISKKISDAQLKQMAAQTNLSYAQAKNILDQLPEVINKLKSESSNNDASAKLRIEELGQLELGRDAVAFDARIKSRKGYDDSLTAWQNVMSFLAQVTDTLGYVMR